MFTVRKQLGVHEQALLRTCCEFVLEELEVVISSILNISYISKHLMKVHWSLKTPQPSILTAPKFGPLSHWGSHTIYSAIAHSGLA
jgi:hypothetical protein